MENYTSQQKSQSIEETKTLIKTEEVFEVQLYKCHNCGATHSSSDRFCSECGAGLKINSCKNCGASVEPDMEICPECGQNLLSETCSFCGEKINSQDAFCPECGNPRVGLTCPNCNTLNFRSFCRKCNTPLNDLAKQALALAKNDPSVKKTYLLIKELAELEKYILEETEDNKQLSEEDIQLIEQHKELLNLFRTSKPDYVEKKIEPKKEGKATKKKLSFSINVVSKEEAMKRYKEKLAEIQETLSSMLPDANMTPQLQRDFYSARKVEIEILTKSKVPIGWLCNAYGCMHSQPNECSKPFSGGKWIYEERDVVVKQWKHV